MAKEEVSFSSVELVKSGTAPTLQQISRAHPQTTPTAYGEVSEVVNRSPEWLLNRGSISSPADPLLDLGLWS